MGYTKIAGTPVVTGLYTLLIPMALFAIFGSSRHSGRGRRLGNGCYHGGGPGRPRSGRVAAVHGLR